MTDLVTLAEALNHLELEQDTTDGAVAQLVAQASAVVRAYCHDRSFESTAVTERYDGGVRNIILRNRPVSAVTKVLDMTRDQTVEDPEDVASYAFRASPPFLFLADAQGNPTGAEWGAGALRWKVTYTAGEATVPEDVKLATLLCVSHRWLHRDPAATSEAVGEEKTTLETGLPRDVRELLANYRRIIL